jgi:hypothetical protein
MNMQDKILAALKEKATAAGYEMVTNFHCSNVGKAYIQPKNGFSNVLSFHFDFQTSYCSLQFYPPGIEPVGTIGFTHPKAIMDAHYLKYEETSRIEALLESVELELAKAARPKKARRKA